MDNPKPPLMVQVDDEFRIHLGKDETFPRFTHEPLLGQRTIRLVQLISPQRSDSDAIFSFVETSLDDPSLEYVAISYAWGKPDFSAPFLVEKSSGMSVLPITPSAWKALHTLGPGLISPEHQQARYLWMDQICIDQGNDEEKGKQVQLMGEIYAKCWYCAIWLGSSDASSENAFRFLRELEARLPPDIQIEEIGVFSKIVSRSHKDIRMIAAQHYGSDLLPPESDAGWLDFARLLCRAWFSRLWVYQEAILPRKDVVAWCGDQTATLVTLLRAAAFLDSRPFGIDFKVRSSMNKMLNDYVRMKYQLPSSLALLLSNSHLYACTDPRDRVYALLGMQEEDPRFSMELIQPDYKKPASIVYEELARNMICARSSLNLCAEATERIGGEIANMPSWVPDWTASPASVFLDYFGPKPDSFWFSASDGRPFKDTKMTRSPDGVLSCRGKKIDIVTAVIPVHMPHDLTLEDKLTHLTATLLPTLWNSVSGAALDNAISESIYQIVQTITLDGFARVIRGMASDTEPTAWTKDTCTHMICDILGLPGNTHQTDMAERDAWIRALTKQSDVTRRRRFVVLKERHLGLMPLAVEDDDFVVVLHGSSLPFVLRPLDNGSYKLIGGCFVEGIMHGEAVNWAEDEADEFMLV